MIKKTLLFSLMFLGLLGFSQNAQSEPKAGQFFISPMFGGHWFEGNQDPFFDGVKPKSTLKHGMTAGLGLGYQVTKSFGVEVVGNYTDSETKNRKKPALNKKDLDAYPVRLDLFYNLISDSAFVPYVAAGAGGILWSQADVDNDWDFLGNYGFGVKYFVTDGIALRADVRHLISNNDYHNNMLYTVGLVFAFGGKDDRKYEPPVAPVEEEEEEVVEEVEEPVVVQEEEKFVEAVAEVDSDGDGVPDSIDRCPDTPKNVKVDEYGCPVDSDGDGVPDYLDKCADTPKGAKVDASGCPVDSDGDGVPDYLDKCANTPKGAKVDASGCPVDSDGDGVPDYLDKCKDTPKGAKVNAHGCWVIKDLYFQTGKSTIVEDSKKNVDEVIVVLKENPDMKIEVQGYTDSTGAVKFNQQLSEKRATSVMNYIVSKGIDKNRVTAKGYGIENPIDTNETEEGRANNRRVELKPEI